MIEAVNVCSFVVLRRLERLLPADVLYRLLRPGASTLTALQTAASRFPPVPAPRPLPDCLGAGIFAPTPKIWHVSKQLNTVVGFFPDRLTSRKWRSRCEVSGLEHVDRAKQGGRPVIFVFLHFGPFLLLPTWLRAAGIPVASVIAGKSADRRRSLRMKDAVAPFPDIPTTFYFDQIGAINRFLAAGHSILIALDAEFGKQMMVPVDDAWAFRMPTGPIRLARRHQAALIPCVLVDEGGWRFRLEIGTPVPPSDRSSGSDLRATGRELLKQMLSAPRAHPELLREDFVERFERISSPVAEAEPGPNPPAAASCGP